MIKLAGTFLFIFFVILFTGCSTTLKPVTKISDLASGEKIVYGAITGLDYADPRVVLTYTSNMFPEGAEKEFEVYYTRNSEDGKLNTLYFAQVVTGFKFLFRTIDLYGSKVKEYHENVLLTRAQSYDAMPDRKDEILRSLGLTLKRIPDEERFIYVGTLDARNLTQLKVEDQNKDVAIAMTDKKSDADAYLSKTFKNMDFSSADNLKLDIMKSTYIEESENIKGPRPPNDELIDIIMKRGL